ncbi:FAD-binding domain-containing protein [uncultured Sphaerotilus sp.]|uniref:FAD-binding domain-containing protein n=1 Tax=uncultured Sphaerotilus sp. TaxID=474984 RepID=UPI0030CA1ED8
MTPSPTLAAAQARLAAVDALAYAHTRNHLDGAVTGLSPWITHGVLSLPQVLAGIAAGQPPDRPIDAQHKLVFELGWRAYFQHVWAHRGDAILTSLHEGPLPDAAYARGVPSDVREARTGVPVIDQAVRTLYATGSLHNHARLWLASYLVHLRKIHWRSGAEWLIGHLLDGDVASNHLSWQWVAGTSSHKPYLFNADNVASHAPPAWHSPGTVVDVPYELLDRIARLRRPVPTQPLPLGVDEPALLPSPPAALEFTSPDAAQVQGRDVWLVHPWALGALPADLPTDTVVLGLVVNEVHNLRPWSAARWQFVGQRMAELTPHRWQATARDWRQVLQGARSVQTTGNLHLQRTLDTLATSRPAETLFPEVERPCTSFSQWWTRVSRAPSPALLAALTPSHSGEPHDPLDHTHVPDRPGDRRPRWHRP